MSDSLELYKKSAGKLFEIRDRNGGADSAEEDAHLDAMDGLWKLLTEEERVEAAHTCHCSDEDVSEDVPEVQFYLMLSPKECPVCGTRLVVYALERDGKRYVVPGAERCFNAEGKAPSAKVHGPCAKALEPYQLYRLEMYTEEVAE
jgi:hypothetical protein